MRRVLSVVLSAALSLGILFAVPVLPNNNLPTDPNPIVAGSEGEEGNGEGEGDQNPGTGIEPQDGFPDGCPDM